jgi:hypothetical protein
MTKMMLSSKQYAERAAQLREHDPDSRAAALFEMLAKLRPPEPDDDLADQYRETLADDEIDTSDIPEATEDWFKKAALYNPQNRK